MITIFLLVSVAVLPLIMLAMLLPSAQRVADTFDKN